MLSNVVSFRSIVSYNSNNWHTAKVLLGKMRPVICSTYNGLVNGPTRECIAMFALMQWKHCNNKHFMHSDCLALLLLLLLNYVGTDNILQPNQITQEFEFSVTQESNIYFTYLWFVHYWALFIAIKKQWKRLCQFLFLQLTIMMCISDSYL